jgi:hypothetical protein
MGCTASVAAKFSPTRRRGSKMTVDTLEANSPENNIIRKRYGHPSYYKGNGYEVGLRVRV